MMNSIDKEQSSNGSDEIALKDLVLKIKKWRLFLLSKWLTIVISGVIGGIIMVVYAKFQDPVYKAELSFVIQDDKPTGGGLGGALGLASQLGIDVGGGGSAGGEFSGDNLLELMKSRVMIEKALLTNVTINGKTLTLADYYLDFKKIRQGWKGKPGLENLHFLPNADRSKFTLKQDSVLGLLHKDLIKNDVIVEKLDKKLSIVSLKVTSINELFAKYFTEILARVVSEFYIQTKTKKEVKNVAILQRQVDSVRRELNGAITGVASSMDANPIPNPMMVTLRVPSQRKTVDVQANTAILSALVVNLQASKMSLLQETPLIQVIDQPILPLEKEKISKIKVLIIGGLVGSLIAMIFLILNSFYKSIMSGS